MSRKLEDIYNESVRERNKRLELTELHNDSKMSIMNAITWVTSAAIYSFETIMDTFVADLVKIFNSRINGTPAYYANAMLKFQYGDELEVNEEGTMFRYPQTDKSKCIISHVSYDEKYNSHYQDNLLVLKVAKGDKRHLERLTSDELLAVRKYLNQIKFAGVKSSVVSRKGDVLVPKMSVYYDGAVELETLRQQIEDALIQYINDVPFDAALYVQKLLDVVQAIPHVTDVSIAGPGQGIFLAQYNDDDELGPLVKIERKSYMSSGYLKQSSATEQEQDIPVFRDVVDIKLED